MKTMKDAKETPQQKVLRVGNYKVLHAEVDGVPVFEVSNLEKTWMVRIPSDYQMYGILNRMLLEAEDDDTEVRANADEWLKMFFMNWQNVTAIPNGHYHHGIVMLTSVYIHPELIKSSYFGVGKKFFADVKKLRQSFLRWADERRKLAENAESNSDVASDAIADKASEMLHGSEE